MKKLKTEINRLSSLLYRDIHKSRQHFLKLTFPDTYRNLIDVDITDDYTMGYARDIGFRASTCTPFYFYDLDIETETKLTIHPFQVMDGTLNYYLKLKPHEVVEYIKPIVERIKAVNGTFITLWHNESLSELNEWKGWKNVYQEIIKLAVS